MAKKEVRKEKVSFVEENEANLLEEDIETIFEGLESNKP